MIADFFSSGNTDLSVVLNQVVSLIPVVLPAALTCLGIRKGISFVMRILHSA